MPAKPDSLDKSDKTVRWLCANANCHKSSNFQVCKGEKQTKFWNRTLRDALYKMKNT